MRRRKKLLMGVVMLCMVLISLIAVPKSAQAADSDFIIENGELTRYNGSGGDVVIPEGVTSIRYQAFSGCSSSLTSITIPSSVTSIGEYAFAYCSSLESINVANGNKVYDSRENCNAIIEKNSNTLIAGCKNTKIPESVTSIGTYAFSGCDSLTSITIPEGVVNIGYGALCFCENLTSITFPKSVTNIEAFAFKGCVNLKELTILNPNANLEDYGIYNENEPTDYISGPTDFKNPIITIKGYENSTAKKYADFMNTHPYYKSHGITFQFVALDGTGDTPTTPTNPSNPTTPTNPQQPTNPTNPTNPSNPTTPTNPSNPTQPSNPSNPTKPTNPTQPTNPTKPLTQEQKTYKLLQKVKATKSMTIKKGKSKTITVTIPGGLTKVTKFSGKKANQIKVTYKSLNKKVATVNSKGKVTAKKKGTAKIKIYLSVHDGKGVSVRGLTVKVKVK